MIDTAYPADGEDPFAGCSIQDLEAELRQLLHSKEVYPESLAIQIHQRRVEAMETEISARHAQAAGPVARERRVQR